MHGTILNHPCKVFKFTSICYSSVVDHMQHRELTNGINPLYSRLFICSLSFDHNDLLIFGSSIDILKAVLNPTYFPAWHQLFYYKGILLWHEQTIWNLNTLSQRDFQLLQWCIKKSICLTTCFVVASSKSNIYVNFLMCLWPLQPSFELLVQAHECLGMSNWNLFCYWATCQHFFEWLVKIVTWSKWKIFFSCFKCLQYFNLPYFHRFSQCNCSLYRVKCHLLSCFLLSIYFPLTF